MTYPARPGEVIVYKDSNGREPYRDWLYDLRDPRGCRCISRRMTALEEHGICGKYKPLGEGVIELKIDSGPGYRVYVGEHKNKIVVLLGGDKPDQENDIQRAKDLFKEYKSDEKLQ